MSTALETFVSVLETQRQKAFESLRTNPSGIGFCEEHTAIVDSAVRSVYESTVVEFPILSEVSIIATGGYGRREMAPFSDVDLTVVPGVERPELDAAIRALFRSLHTIIGTQMRMPIGYAYRLISDAPGLDAKSRTGLLDARLVAGPMKVYRRLNEAVMDSFAVGEFLLEKIRERTEMHQKHNDTPYVVEPHLKEGAGGLRSFHAANWLRIAIGERASRATESFDHILMMRNLLHLQAGKQQDLLTRGRQAELADQLERDVFEMMAEVADSGSQLHRMYLSALEALRESRYPLSKSVRAIRGEARIVGEADAGDAAVGISNATELGLSVSDMPTAFDSYATGPAAAYAISRGEATLRNLDRSGILPFLLPELAQCRTLMPRDTVHRFTVYEHTLRMVRLLDQTASEPFLSAIREELNDLEPLYLAALLHDVGKIDGGRPHSEAGADIAADVCARWGLNSALSDSVVWLVREHLTMAHFIRLRDVESPFTVQEFAAVVKTRERLNLLTLLTWADVNAVSPEVWSPAQDAFLRHLYRSTSDLLEQSEHGSGKYDVAVQRQRLMRQLREDVPEEELQTFLDSLPAYYLASTPPEVVRLHLHFARKAADTGESTLETHHRPDASATDLTVCTLDRPGLLSQLLGVLYAFDLSVVAIRACTTASVPAVALDTFTVTFGSRPVPSATEAQVFRAIEDVLDGSRTVEEILTSRGKEAREQNLYRYTYVPGIPGILEVRAPRGRGMAYRISGLIARHGWNTLAARVGQWADSAAATFYLTAADGSELTREEVDRALEGHL